jgi:hypothetical protein
LDWLIKAENFVKTLEVNTMTNKKTVCWTCNAPLLPGRNCKRCAEIVKPDVQEIATAPNPHYYAMLNGSKEIEKKIKAGKSVIEACHDYLKEKGLQVNHSKPMSICNRLKPLLQNTIRCMQIIIKIKENLCQMILEMFTQQTLLKNQILPKK